jgi:hypothetical protein
LLFRPYLELFANINLLSFLKSRKLEAGLDEPKNNPDLDASSSKRTKAGVKIVSSIRRTPATSLKTIPIWQSEEYFLRLE